MQPATNIPGAVTTILSLVNVQSGDEGSYNVVLSDGMSTVTSQSAFLAVGDRPAITVQPQSQTAILGSDVTFSVTANGTLPLSFRWRNPSIVTNMILQTNVSLFTVRNVQFSSPTNYSVLITNSFGVALSSNALLTVINP